MKIYWPKIWHNHALSLSLFRWGRWQEFVTPFGIRKAYTPQNIEDASRIILLYCLHTYKGDEKIKSFVWDLITPKAFGGGEKLNKNHSGLSGPVPRGRKGKKGPKNADTEAVPEAYAWTIDEKFDTEVHLDKSYRKHLDRHSNKILLRTRMLYYIQNEILATHMSKINTPGLHAR